MKLFAAVVLVGALVPVPADAAAGSFFRTVKGVRATPAGLVMTGARSGFSFWTRTLGEGREPLAYRWDGRAWRSSKLPSGLAGVNLELVEDASGPANVWAATSVGLSDASSGVVEGSSSQVIRWDGRAWRRARVFDRTRIEGLLTRGRSDVWAWGREHDASGRPAAYVSWHYDGRSWARRVGRKGPSGGAFRARGGLWSVVSGAVPKLRQWQGGRWRSRTIPLPKGTRGTALTAGGSGAGNKIVVGLTSERTVKGHPAISTYVLIWDGRRWRTEKPKQAQGRSIHGFIPDGSGGIWAMAYVTSWYGPDFHLHLLHRSAKGVWRQRTVGQKEGWVTSWALVPGTKRVVGLLEMTEGCCEGLIAVSRKKDPARAFPG
ncbi:hypothetical protein [Actinocorallia longicatena]|uniref:hypothetical protein n=1 Tax=Actinocorallia longicatena TaxID=111803 RepID=UPI0031E16D7D